MRKELRNVLFGIMSAVLMILTGAVLAPETVHALAIKEFNPCTITVKFPVEGETSLDYTAPTGLVKGYKSDQSFIEVTTDSLSGGIRPAPKTYNLNVRIYLNRSYD